MSMEERIIIGLVMVIIILLCSHFIIKLSRTYPVYRHLKTGNEYVLLHIARQEKDMSRCVVYVAVDEFSTSCLVGNDSLASPAPFVRDYNEFFDGRFKYLRKTSI